MFLKRIQQGRCKPKVPRHKLALLFGPIHASQIEHKVALPAPGIKFLRSRIQVILKHLINLQLREPPILTISNILQRRTKVLSNKTFRSSNKYLHIQNNLSRHTNQQSRQNSNKQAQQSPGQHIFGFSGILFAISNY